MSVKYIDVLDKNGSIRIDVYEKILELLVKNKDVDMIVTNVDLHQYVKEKLWTLDIKCTVVEFDAI